jgi:hypothetical protein
LFASANGKLCFELLTSFSAAQNHLPRSLAAGGKNALRSRRFSKKESVKNRLFISHHH